MLPILYCAFLKKGGKAAFTRTFENYLSAYDPTVGILFLKSLSCSNDTESLKKLDLCFIDY